MSTNNKLFNFQRPKIMSISSTFMDITSIKRCTTPIELVWSLNIWTLAPIFNTSSENANSKGYFGSKRSLKK